LIAFNIENDARVVELVVNCASLGIDKLVVLNGAKGAAERVEGPELRIGEPCIESQQSFI